MIKITNLSVRYNNHIIFDKLNLDIESDKITCILGDSGIGKTTLLGCIAGTVNYSGTIENNKNISYIFQDNRLIPNISVAKNLELVLKSVIKDKDIRKKQVNDMLKLVELENSKDLFPAELSGGMANRLSMARGFLYPADILLMDESFKGLDPALKSRLIKSFLNLYRKEKRTVIFVTHSIDEALLLANNIIVLKGSPANIEYSTSIDTPQEDRHLTDKSLDDTRKGLLRALIDG